MEASSKAKVKKITATKPPAVASAPSSSSGVKMEDSDEELTRKLLEAVAGHLPAPPPAAAGSPPCPAAGAPSASTSWWASYDWNAGGFFVGDEWWEKRCRRGRFVVAMEARKKLVKVQRPNCFLAFLSFNILKVGSA